MTYHVDIDKVLTKEEIDNLPLGESSSRLSRVPLNSSDISILLSTAINLHSRALENKKENRWLTTSLVGIIGSLSGIILGAILALLLK